MSNTDHRGSRIGDLIGCTIRSKWGPFGDLYLARKNLRCVWNKLFLGEIKFSQRRTRPVKSLWWQIVPMQESTNEWKNWLTTRFAVGAKIPRPSVLGFLPHLEPLGELIAQYRLPMSFRYITHQYLLPNSLWWNAVVILCICQITEGNICQFTWCFSVNNQWPIKIKVIGEVNAGDTFAARQLIMIFTLYFAWGA